MVLELFERRIQFEIEVAECVLGVVQDCNPQSIQITYLGHELHQVMHHRMKRADKISRLPCAFCWATPVSRRQRLQKGSFDLVKIERVEVLLASPLNYSKKLLASRLKELNYS